MIKAVVFDMDHTLFDRYATIRKVMPAFCEAFDVAVSEEEAAELLCKYDRKLNIFGWPTVFKKLKDKGMFNTAPHFAQYAAFLYEHFTKISVDYPFTIPTLQTLRDSGVKVGMITNGDHDIQAAKIENLGYGPYFDEIIISGDCDFEKPEPEIFIEMAKRLGIQPQEMAYVGDHPVNDVDGAREAGCVPIWVKTYGIWIDDIEEAPYEVEDISFVPALLNKINQTEA
ncbi:MAG: HAD-IA family hydrolase [Clostridia bacterium]|nr:HAD-IA family hydrolase [Clostridia bacterium]